MKNHKKILSILLAVIVIITITTMLPTKANAAVSDYDTNEYTKLQTFLNQPSAVLGISNGERLNTNYNADNPATWTGVVWNNETPKKVIEIGFNSAWNYKSLAGEFDLSGFTQLKQFYCTVNQLTALNFSGATLLEYIYCSDNKLTSLIVGEVPALVSLYSDNNQLTSLDLSKVPNLLYFTCSNNQLSTLDIRNNPKIITVHCDYNKLTSLYLVSSTDMTVLSCDNNLLTSLDLSMAPNLEYFHGSSNQLATLNVGDNGVRTLDCGDNLLTSLDLSGAQGLREVNCEDNRLTSLNVSGISSLNSINCNNNQLTSLDLGSLDFLHYFECENNKLIHINGHMNGFDIDLSAVGRGYVELNSQAYYYLSAIVSFNGSSESYLEVTAVPQEGAQFNYWTQSGVILDKESFPQIIDDFSEFTVINLVAHFTGTSTDIKHIVTFDVKGGTHVGGQLSQEVEHGGSADAPVVTRSGYDFMGWDTTFNNITENITVSAVWAPQVFVAPILTPSAPYYQVTFDLNGGLFTGGGALTQAVEEGGSAVAPTTTRTGYNFMGWNGSFDKVNKVTLVKATWEVISDTHVVNFDLNGGTRTGGGELIQNVKNGEPATAPEVMRDGYSLIGWNVAFDNVIEDITVTADWEEKAPDVQVITFTVRYDANGGKGTVPVDNMKYVEGDTAILDDGSSLSRDGYQFVGWSLTSDGDAIAFTDVLINEDVTYYAVWEVVELPEVIVEDSIPKTGNTSGVVLGSIMLLFGAGIAGIELLYKRKIVNN